jgi:predicted nuclease of predicted toxin-antitoxin system
LNLLCDEGVERQVVEALRTAGHAVTYVAEMSPGVTDEEVLQRSAAEGAVLITSDKDFGELVFRQGRAHHGLVLLRLPGLEPKDKGALVVASLAEHGDQLLEAFSVIESGRIRIRRGGSV